MSHAVKGVIVLAPAVSSTIQRSPGHRGAGIWACLALSLLALTACNRVHPHRSLPAIELGEPSLYPTLQAYAGAPILAGNTVQILLNGNQIFPAVTQAIRSARRSVTYAQYFYEDGPVAREIAEALAGRCRAGLPVHVLLDGVGTLKMPDEYTRLLERVGCEVRTFRSLRPWTVRRANNRNHRRILIVDGRIGFTGGSGVSHKWMGDGRTEDHWRDTDIRIEGPAVEWLQAAFVENWLEASGTALGGDRYFPGMPERPGAVAVQVVRSSPSSGDYAMYTTLLVALASARRSIRITNPYFLLDAAMTETLLERVRRGVRVEVLVPGAIDHNFVRQASRATWGRFLEGGVTIYEYVPALLHAKTIVIDGVWATVGSTNLDNRSFALNDELNVIVYDRGVAAQFEAAFKDDVAHARIVTYDAWRRRGLTAKLFELFVAPLRDQL
jgi:cardiolipin synthase